MITVSTTPRTDTRRIIIHLDYDCFYASVIEAHQPNLRGKPLAIQQKQIIVTCNYEARKRGLHKLQLIREAKKLCPELTIVLGEDLTQFRDASKELYSFVQTFSWNGKAERLGLDEVFLDVTDICDYNLARINWDDPGNSFFHLTKSDLNDGFSYDARKCAGLVVPSDPDDSSGSSKRTLDEVDEVLEQRLILGSRLAQYIRELIEKAKGGYTCTAGISTSKLLAKLVGNTHKPRNQTTLLPPLAINVPEFLDGKEIRAIPGIGFKSAAKLREWYLKRPLKVDGWELDQGDQVTVRDLRTVPGVGPVVLERVLSGPGAPRGIGEIVWKLLHGVDETEVAFTRNYPKQISIEDSYVRLDTLERVREELIKLSSSLVSRMRMDLLLPPDDNSKQPRWASRPRTLRMTTRPRLQAAAAGDITYLHGRISRSTNPPAFLFDLSKPVDEIAPRLVKESLMPMFRLLHPERTGWNLSLMNVAISNMDEVDEDQKGRRDIGDMFRKLRGGEEQEQGMDMSIDDRNDYENKVLGHHYTLGVTGSEDNSLLHNTQSSSQASNLEEGWIADDGYDFEETDQCGFCGAIMPAFAMTAHERFHGNYQMNSVSKDNEESI